MRTPVADQVEFRIDFPAFLRTLSSRDQSMARRLEAEEPAKEVARRFGISPARVTQLRRSWLRQWRIFQDESSKSFRPASAASRGILNTTAGEERSTRDGRLRAFSDAQA
jgi:hypothetical protein